ncbi:8503_t:CDS:1, partial [Cetraspora pellucida]
LVCRYLCEVIDDDLTMLRMTSLIFLTAFSGVKAIMERSTKREVKEACIFSNQEMTPSACCDIA